MEFKYHRIKIISRDEAEMTLIIDDTYLKAEFKHVYVLYIHTHVIRMNVVFAAETIHITILSNVMLISPVVGIWRLPQLQHIAPSTIKASILQAGGLSI